MRLDTENTRQLSIRGLLLRVEKLHLSINCSCSAAAQRSCNIGNHKSERAKCSTKLQAECIKVKNIKKSQKCTFIVKTLTDGRERKGREGEHEIALQPIFAKCPAKLKQSACASVEASEDLNAYTEALRCL